jgi:hypothetical protein
VLAGGALGSPDAFALLVDKGQPAHDAVRAVGRDLDPRLPALLVDVVAVLVCTDRKAECARWAVPNGADDLVQTPAARGDERVPIAVEHRRQPIGAEPRVGTDAAVVEDGELLGDIGVAVVGHAPRVLRPAKADLGVRAIAQRLDRRASAAAQRHLRPGIDPLPEVIDHVGCATHQVGAVRGHLDARTGVRLQLGELGDEGSLGLRVTQVHNLTREVLQRSGRLAHTRIIGAGPQSSRRLGEIDQPVTHRPRLSPAAFTPGLRGGDRRRTRQRIDRGIEGPQHARFEAIARPRHAIDGGRTELRREGGRLVAHEPDPVSGILGRGGTPSRLGLTSVGHRPFSDALDDAIELP